MENQATMSDFDSILASRGVTRRSFMKLCAGIAAAAGLSQLAVPRVAQALEESVIGATSGNLYPVIWIEGASCTGCTESFAQVETPDVASVVLDMISLNYSETLSAAAGHSMEEAKAQTIAAGNYILIYEGAVLEAFDGNALRVAGETGITALVEAAESANAVVAVGSCAVNGGWMAAAPNPAQALGVQQYLKKVGVATPVVNVPGCPVNPEWVMSVLVDVVVMKDMDLLVNRLNEFNMPGDLFNQTIHDNCERRGHFENGEFVYEFGSKEEEMGYCLYPVGCKGPQTRALCGVTLWNNRRSWCVQSGAPHRLLRGQPEQPGRQLGRGEHSVLQAHARPAHRSSEPAAHHHRRDHHRHRGGGPRGARLRHEALRPHGRRRSVREDPQVGCQASRPGDRHLRRPGRRRPGSRRRAAAEERRTP